ncbi:hypothetical protein SUGI_1078250 [Cryptomeria japonica]|nr:hypothetical protein SUGI_1078250 [Cryptomeria japonica]
MQTEERGLNFSTCYKASPPGSSVSPPAPFSGPSLGGSPVKHRPWSNTINIGKLAYHHQNYYILRLRNRGISPRSQQCRTENYSRQARKRAERSKPKSLSHQASSILTDVTDSTRRYGRFSDDCGTGLEAFLLDQIF